MDDLRRAALSLSRQGLVTFWSPNGRNTISPERAAAMLRFLVERRVRGANDLLVRVLATGAVGTSTALAAHGRSPRAPDGMTIQVRDRLRTALAERFGGELPAMAKQLGMTAAKTAKILGGFSNLSAADAERITERLDPCGASPAQLALTRG